MNRERDRNIERTRYATGAPYSRLAACPFCGTEFERDCGLNRATHLATCPDRPVDPSREPTPAEQIRDAITQGATE